jgi:hypothetical protein
MDRLFLPVVPKLGANVPAVVGVLEVQVGVEIPGLEGEPFSQLEDPAGDTIKEKGDGSIFLKK